MKEHILDNGIKIRYYDSIDDLPIVRHHKFNEFMMIGTEIGSDMESVDRHLVNLVKMIDRDEKDDAKNEIMNMRQSIQFILENMSPEMLAFSMLVDEVDGVKFTDTSEIGCRALLTKLSAHGLSFGIARYLLEEVKKKLRPRSRFTSPISLTEVNQRSST